MNIAEKFIKMGARAKITPGSLQLNVMRDGQGEYFDIRTDLPLMVEDVQIKERHLLLTAVEQPVRSGQKTIKHKFLCGHDERQWFVAGIVGSASSVATAKESLKPRGAKAAEGNTKVRRKNRNKRKNEAWQRQGEWFFIPCPDINPTAELILKKEPIQRGRSKPHICSELYRVGGQTVYVSHDYPNGITDDERRRLLKAGKISSSVGFRAMRRGMKVYVRGSVSHPDHKTIGLAMWHRVEVNIESNKNVAFLD